MMDGILTDVRTRLWGIVAGLGHIHDDLATVWVRAQSLLPGIKLLRLVGLVVVFVAGGIGACLLFSAWPARGSRILTR